MIRTRADKIERAKIDKVILFGSYARGKVTEHSDVDLILVAKRFERASIPDSKVYGLNGITTYL